MNTIVLIAVAVLAFLVGTAFGIYITCETIASGKVKNVKVLKK